MSNFADTIYGVYIFTHGNTRSIWFTDGTGISIDGRSIAQVRDPNMSQTPVLRQISDLNQINVHGSVHLRSCNPGHLTAYAVGGSFASVLSTRVSGGSVIGYDGNVSFGSIASIFARITGNFSPRLSRDQDSFHSWTTFHGGTRRSPSGPQQFVNGQLNNSFVPGTPTRIPLTPQPGSAPVPFPPPTISPGQWR